jgi:hypothetical protein
MSSTTGQISGTPTATLATTTFTVAVTDAAAAVSSKTFTLTVDSPPAPGALYPNRPVSFTQTSEIDFSQAVPGLPDTQDRPISGAPGWFMIFHGGTIAQGGKWDKVTDGTALQSPSDVWQGHWAPGSYGGGIIGQGGGHGIGNLFTRPAGAPKRLYMSLRVKFDFDASLWHPISNKFVNIVGDHSQILMQLKEGGNWRHAEELGFSGFPSFFIDNAASNPPNSIHYNQQVSNVPVPNRQWTQIEVLIDIPNKIYKIWQDGVLTTDATPTFASTQINAVGVYAFRGGGGETLTTDLYFKYDHFFVAW